MTVPDPHPTAVEKAELRRRLRFRRQHFVAKLDPLAQMSAFRAAPAPLTDMLENLTVIGGYAAIGEEADILHLLGDLGITKAIALPFHTARTAPMMFRIWQPGDPVSPGPWGTPQPPESAKPAQPELLLVPLLGFDRMGGRIGQGGGHYDRYFAANPGPMRVGIGWSVQEVDKVPATPHDCPMDAILTEQEWIVTGDRW